MQTRVTKAVIPAAGLGTRFLPATKAIPKEMLPIVDVPTLQLIIEEALAAGIEEIVLVTGRGKSSIEDHFDVSYELDAVQMTRPQRRYMQLRRRQNRRRRRYRHRRSQWSLCPSGRSSAGWPAV